MTDLIDTHAACMQRTRARRADERHNLTGIHVERDAVEHALLGPRRVAEGHVAHAHAAAACGHRGRLWHGCDARERRAIEEGKYFGACST